MYTHQECEYILYYIGNILEYTSTPPLPQKCARVTEESTACDNGGCNVGDGGDFDDDDDRNQKKIKYDDF